MKYGKHLIVVQTIPKTKKPLISERLVFVGSGWQDSNLRPPAPKAGAITGLRYTPNNFGVQI